MSNYNKSSKNNKSSSLKQSLQKLPKEFVETVETVAKVSNNVNSYVKNLNRQEAIKKVSFATVKLLQSAVSNRYSKKYRAGIIRDGDLFRRPRHAAYFEENIRNESKLDYVKKTVGIPVPSDSYRKKRVEIGPRMNGSFAAIARGPFHKKISHKLLDTELDFGNSVNKDSDFRRNELVLNGGFNQKTISFMGTETFLTYEKMLEMITSVNNEYSPDSCSGYWSLIANQSRQSRNTDKLYAGIPRITTKLKLKSKNPCHSIYVKVNLLKIKEKTKNLEDLISLLFDTETKIEASKRIIESETKRAKEAIESSKNTDKLKKHCATMEYLYRKIDSENCHRPCQSIDREDIYSRTTIEDKTVDETIRNMESKRKDLSRKDFYPSYIEIDEMDCKNPKKRKTLLELFSDVRKFEKGVTVINKEFLENEEFFTKDQIKEYQRAIEELENLGKDIGFDKEIEKESLNIDPDDEILRTFSQVALADNYVSIMRKHIKKLDKLGEEVLVNRRKPKTTFINFNVDTSLQLTDYEAFNENCQIVKSWEAELKPNNTYEFDITQNFNYGICINDLLSQIARFDPKHPFGYVMMLEIIGEKGASIKCLEDKFDYFGYAPTQIIANAELEVEYITKTTEKRYQPEEENGKQLSEAIQLYWDTAVDEDADRILEEIFYPKRDRRKFNLDFNRLTYNKECTDKNKFFVETFEMVFEERLGVKPVDFDLKDFLSETIETQNDVKTKTADANYSEMRPSMDTEEDDDDFLDLDNRDYYET